MRQLRMLIIAFVLLVGSLGLANVFLPVAGAAPTKIALYCHWTYMDPHSCTPSSHNIM